MDSPAGGVSLRLDLSRQALWNALPLIAICLLPVLFYLPFLTAPFERDEGVYATIAQGLLHGKVPYRDLFDNKPPLVYGWYALSFKLFGQHVVAPRILASLLLSFTSLSIFGQTRMMFSRGVAYAAAAVFGLSTALPLVALHANTEAYMVLPLAISLVAFTAGMRSGRARWFLLAGVLCGLAVMTKQVAVWNLLALTIVASVWRHRQGEKLTRSIGFGLLLPLGAAGAIAAVALPFAATGSLGDLFYANVSYNWLYVSLLSYSQRLADFAQGTLFFSLAAAPLVGGAAWGLLSVLRRRKRPIDYLIVTWAVASAVGVASGGRFFPHYFLHLLPAMAVLCALVVHEHLGNLSMQRLWKPAAAGIAFLVFISLVTNGLLYLAPLATEERVAENVYQQAQWANASAELGTYIQKRTSPNDTIFNFGREAQVYFYADRQPAVRYFSDWPFWSDERTLDETVSELRIARPVYIIDSAQPPLFPDYAQYHPPVLMSLLADDYQYEGRIFFADLYRLKDSAR